MNPKDLGVGFCADEQTINKVFCCLISSASTTQKQEFLNKHMNPVIQQILEDTYGPQKYYVKKFEYFDHGNLTLDENYDQWHQLLQDLANRKYTGNEAIDKVTNLFEQYCARDQVWLYRILQRNLKIGIGETFSGDTGIVDKYPCALANVLEKVKNVDPLDGTWYVSRKLDGCRCHAHVDVDNQTVIFRSRQGKVFTTLSKLAPEILKFFDGGHGQWVIDGEICIVDDNGHEDFRGLMSLVTRKNFTLEKPKYKVFDLLPADVFWGRSEGQTFSNRHNMLAILGQMYRGDMIDVIEQELLETQDQLDTWLRRREEGAWEGLMIRKDVLYKGKRSNDLLKIKPMKDSEYIITGIVPGKMTKVEPGVGSFEYDGVSALIIQHKGNEVKVGSGLSYEQRVQWLKNPELVIGKTATIQYFEETQDSKTGLYSLRFPVLKYIYENGRTV